MILTVEEKNIIKLSFAELIKENVNIAECFYNNLFEMAPLIEPMFKSEPNILEKHFNELISTAVDKIDNFEAFQSSLLELGKRHKKYGAQLSHFEIVKSALMLSIQYELKGQYNEALGAAWSKYIDILSQVLIDGLLTDD